MPMDAPWPQTVLVRQEVHACMTVDEIQSTYNDATAIRSLGAGMLICVPAVKDGVTLGALNFIGREGDYDEASIRAMRNAARDAVDVFAGLGGSHTS